MAFCGNCGASVADGTTFCSACGKPTAASAAATSGAPAAAAAPVASSGGLTANVAGALAYFVGWITAIIFLVLEPYNKDKFVRFHAFQSLFFSIALIPIYIVFAIVLIIVGHISSILSGLLYAVFALGLFALWLFLMFQAYSNKQFKLPVIGDFAAKQAGV